MTLKRRKPKAKFNNFFKLNRLSSKLSNKSSNQTRSSTVSLNGEEVQPKKPRRGIYLLPNAFTTAALFGGFYAIVMGMNGEFIKATIAIFIAMVLDSLDGRVARLTNTQSEFGAEYDSLSDMVSFGAAPALIAYEWGLRSLGQWGWLAAFVYCACAALRLARFNVNINVVDKHYFQGISSTASAGIVAGFIWVMSDLEISGMTMRWVIWFITVMVGLTMVSNVPYYNFKDINLRKSVPFAAPFVLVMAYVLIVSDPPKVLFGLFAAYWLSGYVVFLWRWRKGRPVSILQTEVEVHDDH